MNTIYIIWIIILFIRRFIYRPDLDEIIACGRIEELKWFWLPGQFSNIDTYYAASYNRRDIIIYGTNSAGKRHVAACSGAARYGHTALLLQLLSDGYACPLCIAELAIQSGSLSTFLAVMDLSDLNTEINAGEKIKRYSRYIELAAKYNNKKVIEFFAEKIGHLVYVVVFHTTVNTGNEEMFKYAAQQRFADRNRQFACAALSDHPAIVRIAARYFADKYGGAKK